jgi:cephalosporin hydroxylase
MVHNRIQNPKFFLPKSKNLRKKAKELHQELSNKVTKYQGGVPTFYDNFIAFFVDTMTNLFPKDEWENSWQQIQGSKANWFKREVTRLQLVLAARNQGRYVTMDARNAQANADTQHTVYRPPYGDEISQHDMAMSQGTFECMQWKGMPLFKTVYDFSLMSMMIWDVKPKTIIELGSGTGASAIWMADLGKLFALDCQVFSVDISKPELESNGVEFIKGDCNIIHKCFPENMLRELAHPWIIIEDAHVNLLGIISHFTPYFQVGDYLIVEDSRVDKIDILRKWASENSKKFKVDTKYTDFYGRNATCSPDAIFTCV